MAHENANEAVPDLEGPRFFIFHYPYRQSIAISFFATHNPPDIDIKIFREDVMKLEMPNSTVHRVIGGIFGEKNLLVYFKDAGVYEDNPSESLSIVMLRRPNTEAITWFSCSHSLNGLLFHLEQKALISVPAFIRPEENPPHVVEDAIAYYLTWNQTDLHTRLCLLLDSCFPPQLLLPPEPEDDQEDDNVSLSHEYIDARDVEIADEHQAPAENDKAVASEVSINNSTDLPGDNVEFISENDNERLEIADDNQAPPENDEAAAPSETDSGDDELGSTTHALNPPIPPNYAARLAPFRPEMVRDYTRLQDNLRDTVHLGEQMLASFNHCKSLADYQRDKQAFLTAAQGEKKTPEEWRVWAVTGKGFGGRNCRDNRARQWAQTFHAMGWVDLKDE